MDYSKETELFGKAIHLIDSWRLQGLWSDAKELLTGLRPVTALLGGKAIAVAHLHLGKILTDEAMFGGQDTFAERSKVLEKALTLAKPSDDPLLLGDIYDAIGFSVHVDYLAGDRSEEPENELPLFQMGLDLRQQAGALAQVAESLFHIGLVYDVIRKDYDTASTYHGHAYQRANKAGAKVTASYAIRHIGFAKLAHQDLAGAKEDFVKSLELREATNFVPGIAFALATLAHVEAELENRITARQQLERARRIFETLKAFSHVESIDKQIAALNGE